MKILNNIRDLSDKTKGTLYITLSGFGVLILAILTPYSITSLILGILLFLLGGNYYKNKKGKKRRSFVFMGSIFLGTLLIGSFLFTFVSPSSSSSFDGETFTYNQEDLVLNGQIYDFQHDLTNQYGEIVTEGELRVPTRMFLIHYAVSRDGGLIYELKFFTNVKMIDNNITLLILVGNNSKYTEAVFFLEKNYNLTTSSSLYDYELEDGTIYIDGSANVELYFFQFKGQIDPNTPSNISTISSVEIHTTYTDPEDYWGYSVGDIPTLTDVLNDIWGRNIFFMMFFILFFTSIFVIMWVTGQVDKVKYPLNTITITGFLLLFVELILSPDLPIIREALWLLDTTVILAGLIPLVLIIGMAVAVIIWSMTIGNAIVFCMLLWYMWDKILGSFLGDAFE